MASNFNINLGPHSNATQGNYKYITCDDIRVEYSGTFDSSVVVNDIVIGGVVKTTDVVIGVFDGGISDGNFDDSGTCLMSDLCTRVADLETAISTLQSSLNSHSH